MPLQFEDAAQHAASLPNLHDRVAAFFEAIRTRVAALDGRDAVGALIADLDQHRPLMVSTIVGDGSQATAGFRGRLGPGETPFMPGDRPVGHNDAMRLGNPTAPIDSSGAKVHPADAITLSQRTDPKAGQAFGGNGMGTSADVRTQAALAARDGSLAPRLTAAEAQRLDRAGADQRSATGRTIIPVISNEIVPGSEVTRDGQRYVTKRKGDGTTYETLDVRPQNAPV